MALGVHADPDLPPRRRDRQRVDALQHLGVVDPLPRGIEVLKAAPAPPAGDPGRRAIGASQPWHGIALPAFMVKAAAVEVRCAGALAPRRAGARSARATS